MTAALVTPLDTELRGFELSDGQAAIWSIEKRIPGTAAYNEAFAWRLRAGADPARLLDALVAVAARHPALATTFVEGADGRVLQHSGSAGALTVTRVALPDEAALRDALAAEAARPFRLDRSCARATLFEPAGALPVLAFTAHHLVIDLWSLTVLLDDLAAAYAAPESAAVVRPATEAHGAAEATPFAELVRWQRELATSPEGARLARFWQDTLAGAPESTELPATRPRPARPRLAGASFRARVPARTCERLRALAAERGTTLCNVFQASFYALLHRLTGQTDLVVGCPSAGRPDERFARTVGYFVSSLPIRVDASGDPVFAEWLPRVQRRVLAAIDHQDLPFARIVEAVRPPRCANRSPIFQTMLAWERPHLAPGGGDDHLPLEPAPLDVPRSAAKLDLLVACIDLGGAVDLEVEHDLDALDREAADGVVEAWRALLAGIAANPWRRLSELPLAGPRTRRAALDAGPHSERPLADDDVLDVVRRAAAAHPERVAVREGPRAITYAELVERADGVAAELAARGAAGRHVGIHGDPGIDALVAILGCFRVGAAYVPLPPSLPALRRAYMVADAAVALVLVCGTTARIPDLPASVDQLPVRAAASSRRTPPTTHRPPAAERTAYVMYTSGSTGDPKGVRVAHRSVVAFLDAMASELELAGGEAFLATTNLSFDISVLELLLPLATGGEVRTVPRRTVRDAAALARTIDALAPDVVQATPTLWRMLLATGWSPGAAMRVLSGGEALAPDLASSLGAGGARVWNLYGPTEATVWATAHRVAGDEDPVPLGRPLANVAVHVLDAHLEPLPAGLPGRVFLGGAGVAQGYLGKPELTRTRFVASPFGPVAGEPRLYDTGDLGRLRADGTLEHLGRADDQVKLRGVRVELGEIERAVRDHPAVADAAVALVRDGGEARLDAYLVLAGADVPDRAELGRFLRARLPLETIPSTFTVLARLPETASGKVDRKALAGSRGTVLGAAARDDGAPLGEVEAAIASCWKEVLGVARVGADDNFFDLGGTSLRLAECVALGEARGLTLSAELMLTHQTVGALARALANAPDAHAPSPPTAVRRATPEPLANGRGAAARAASATARPVHRMAARRATTHPADVPAIPFEAAAAEALREAARAARRALGDER